MKTENSIKIHATVVIDDTKEELKEEIEETKEKLQGEFRSEIKKTDDRITLEVEHINTSIAAIDIKADNINLSVNNRITNEMAAINLKADNINLSVNNRITKEVSAIDERAGRIEIAVSNLDRDTKSAINVMQNSINLKVDKGGSITDINLSPGVATINADKINLNGAVIVSGDISGATNINVSKNITVGETLHIGQSWTGNYNIKFGGEYGAMQIKAQDDMISFSANSCVKIPHGPLWIENNSAVTSSVVGMNLVWNGSQAGSGGRLYVRSYSGEIGYLELKK